MTHFHVQRSHGDNEAYSEFSDACIDIIRELNEGLTISVARAEWSKMASIIEVMNHYIQLSEWELESSYGDDDNTEAYRSMGHRSWEIRRCHDFGCRLSGGSW